MADDLRFVLTFGKQFLVTSTQSPLRFPCDRFGFFIQTLLPFRQPASNPGFVLVGPGRFYDHTSQVSIARFGDAATLNASAAGMFARNHAAVTHQLPRVREAGQRADFSDDTDGNNLAHATQRLQSLHHLLDFGGRSRNRIIDRLLQPVEPVSSVLDFMDVIEKRGLQGGYFKAHLALDPVHVLVCPILLHIFGRLPAVPQKKLASRCRARC